MELAKEKKKGWGTHSRRKGGFAAFDQNALHSAPRTMLSCILGALRNSPNFDVKTLQKTMNSRAHTSHTFVLVYTHTYKKATPVLIGESHDMHFKLHRY